MKASFLAEFDVFVITVRTDLSNISHLDTLRKEWTYRIRIGVWHLPNDMMCVCVACNINTRTYIGKNSPMHLLKWTKRGLPLET